MFRKLDIIGLLTDEDRLVLQPAPQRFLRLEPREELVKEGERLRYVDFVIDGWGCRYHQLEDGRRQIVAFFLPGDVCGLTVTPFESTGHAWSALTPVTVVRYSREELRAIVTRSSTIERTFWIETLIEGEIQREWTVNLGRRTATERMAHLFCELRYRLDLVGATDGAECDMPVNQADLADALGLSAVHVSRTLQELRSAGLVELKGRKLRIRDERALQEVAMFDPSYLHLKKS